MCAVWPPFLWNQEKWENVNIYEVFIYIGQLLPLSSGSVNVFVVLQMQPLTNYTGLDNNIK